MLETIETDVTQTEAGEGALRGRDIVCFSHDWTGDPLSKTHLMRLLARENHVLWVNSIGYRAPTASKADISRAFKKLKAAGTRVWEVEPNIFVVNPLALPVYGRKWARAFNQRALALQVRRAMRKLGFRQAINWIFNPAAAVVARQLGEASLIYHCVDEYAAFSGVSASGLADLEQRLLRTADLVIVSAESLRQTKARHNPRTVLVRHGVDYERFRSALDAETQVPDEISRLPRPIIGYFGLMSSDWIDVELLTRVARHFAGGSLVMLGKVAMDLSELRQLPNVHLLGRKPYESLPAYCKGFDVGIIPFPINPVTLHANPLKAREYLAAGLPVVATDIPEVRVLPECRVATGHEAFLGELEAVLAEPGVRQWRSELMRSEGWQARLVEIEKHFASMHVAHTARTPGTATSVRATGEALAIQNQ